MKGNTKQEILNMTRKGLDVFNYYLPHNFPMRKNFKSPFYEDGKASCNVFEGKDNIWRFKDFGEGGEYCGDCFWFVGQMKGYNLESDFPKILAAIIADLQLPLNPPFDSVSLYRQSQPPKPLRPLEKTSGHQSCKAEEKLSTSEYSYMKKEYTESELGYWSHYGITKAILERYKVYSLSSFSSFTREDRRPYTIKTEACEPLFMYDQGSSAKVYRPFSSLRFLNAGEKPENYAFGMEQLPMKGDMIFITGGEKDVLSFAVRGFNAISFNSETSNISMEVVEMLKRRFKHVVICYDVDDTGLKASIVQANLLSAYKVLRLYLPLAGTKTEKDVSDYFAKGHTRNDMQTLVTAMLERELYQQTMSLVKSCEIDMGNPPEASQSVVKIGNTILGSYDNLLCVSGGEGAGKSNCVSAIEAGALSLRPLPSDITLGMEVTSNPDGKAVLHYDTEQSEAQLYKNIKRSLKRAGLNDKPSYYHALCLTAFTREERLKLIQESMDMYYYRHGGIHFVVIDGVADLIRSANDEIESVKIVEELYRLAGIYNTCIVCVLHLIPGGFKLRGHLGSELQRKAAGIMSIDKDKANPSLSVVKAIKARDGDPLDVPILTFGWNKDIDMHVYRGRKTVKESDERKFSHLADIAQEILIGDKTMLLEEFAKAISKRLFTEYDLIDKRTVASRIRYMLKKGIISKSEEGMISIKGRSYESTDD